MLSSRPKGGIMQYLDATSLNKISIKVSKGFVEIEGYDGYDSHSRLVAVKFNKKVLKQLLRLIGGVK